MIFEIGEKVHIVERRQFAEDLRRHLAGEIIMCTEHAIRLKGYVWVFDQINIIPAEVNLDEIKYVNVPKKGLLVTDGKKFSLEISEFGATR
jgi:hypothetical protein